MPWDKPHNKPSALPQKAVTIIHYILTVPYLNTVNCLASRSLKQFPTTAAAPLISWAHLGLNGDFVNIHRADILGLLLWHLLIWQWMCVYWEMASRTFSAQTASYLHTLHTVAHKVWTSYTEKHGDSCNIRSSEGVSVVQDLSWLFHTWMLKTGGTSSWNWPLHPNKCV